MARLVVQTAAKEERGYDGLKAIAAQRLGALGLDQCPVEFTSALMDLYLSESCGKCTPCRVGLKACNTILKRILAGEGEPSDVELLRATAQAIYTSADCAIGFEAANSLLKALAAFEEDFTSHVERDFCTTKLSAMPPCRDTCPAHIDIPGYIACIREGRMEDALKVIRNDNPLPTVCGYVCEHPCEFTCRRTLVDDAVNICGLKRYAADNAKPYDAPTPLEPTGKKVSVIGGGPAGLTCAYYLQLMGHDVTIYEALDKLGGMVRYGIPDYRLPQAKLDADIDFILSTGIKVKTGTSVGQEISFDEIREASDAVYLSIGAHLDKKLRVEGEDLRGVVSAVSFLRAAGAGAPLNLKGKRVVIVGGGNVAMDCTRTAKRLGAASVECVYRRRIADMTALDEEIHEALAEGCQITELQAPVRVESNENGEACALVVQPQLISDVKGGRPAPVAASAPERTIECDLVIVAIGQDIDTTPFQHIVETERGAIVAEIDGSILNTDDVFAGGDAQSGPATVIKAIAAGKAAAANIDALFGYAHDVHVPVDVPAVKRSIGPTGRVELANVNFAESSQTFDISKYGMSEEEACQESSRCLRCDYRGFGATCDWKELAW